MLFTKFASFLTFKAELSAFHSGVHVPNIELFEGILFLDYALFYGFLGDCFIELLDSTVPGVLHVIDITNQLEYFILLLQ